MRSTKTVWPCLHAAVRGGRLQVSSECGSWPADGAAMRHGTETEQAHTTRRHFLQKSAGRGMKAETEQHYSQARQEYSEGLMQERRNSSASFLH